MLDLLVGSLVVVGAVMADRSLRGRLASAGALISGGPRLPISLDPGKSS
jgi:hypothetical protein